MISNSLLYSNISTTLAMNNLAVCAQDAGLKVKAVENYKNSSKYDNTLAMANCGYLLLNAGFCQEAEEIARKASQMESPHENIFSLLSKIRETQKEQDKKWDELKDLFMEYQKDIRKYIESYYGESIAGFDGNWTTKDGKSIGIQVSNNKLNVTWNEQTPRYISCNI